VLVRVKDAPEAPIEGSDEGRMLTRGGEPSRRAMRRGRARRAGYTLIEILAAVTIVGILAVLAITGYRKYFASAYSSEPRGMLQGIRGAQMMVMADRMLYESCSETFADPDTYFPAGGEDGTKTMWGGTSHTEAPCWQRLNVRSDSPVRYGYATVAGAGPGFPNLPVVTSQPAWPTLAAGVPWFVVAASADIDQNGRRSMFWSSSLDKQINVFQEAE
jgi:type IV pilus assembly protein PilA